MGYPHEARVEPCKTDPSVEGGPLGARVPNPESVGARTRGNRHDELWAKQPRLNLGYLGILRHILGYFGPSQIPTKFL
jgi:hypothetical protein